MLQRKRPTPEIPNDDPRDLSDAAVHLAHALDELDWPCVRGLLHRQVDFVHPALKIDHRNVPTDRVAAAWRSFLPGFDATQHMIGPLVVSASPALTLARAAIRIHHFIDSAPSGREWTVFGMQYLSFVRAPAGWRISAIKLQISHQTGNILLPSIARQRAIATPRSSPT